MTDINRGTSGVNLPEEVSNEIIAKAQESSAIMRLATRVDLPGNGVSIPLITGDPTANFVDETAVKPVSRPTLSNKSLKGNTVAVIVPFSNQFQRDAERLYSAIVDRLPGALAQRFDAAAFGTTPYGNVDSLAGATAVDIETDVYAGLVSADSGVSTAGYVLDGWALAPQARGHLLGAVDGNDRPLFLNSAAEGAVPMLLGAPTVTSKAVYKAGDPEVLGFAGDWSQAFYGVVDGVSISISDQASLTDGENTINLWERNMFAVRAEFEVDFVVVDLAAFRKLTGATGAGEGEGEGE